jgi:phospholipid transport system substrate-binding protein
MRVESRVESVIRARWRAVATAGIVSLFAALTQLGFAASESPAQALVRTTAETFQARLRADAAVNDADPANVLTSAEELILPHFNFTLMAQRALGRLWRDFSTEQRTRFIDEFRTLLLRTYAKTLNDYRDSTISYLTPRELAKDAVRVRTEVARSSGGPPVQIDYEVRSLTEGWKVCDVTVNGVSLVISYRAGFAKDFGALGAEGLIAQLVERNQAPL